jgi:hypothetical protein
MEDHFAGFKKEIAGLFLNRLKSSSITKDTFWQVLQAAKEHLGMSDIELGDALGSSPASVYRWSKSDSGFTPTEKKTAFFIKVLCFHIQETFE